MPALCKWLLISIGNSHVHHRRITERYRYHRVSHHELDYVRKQKWSSRRGQEIILGVGGQLLLYFLFKLSICAY